MRWRRTAQPITPSPPPPLLTSRWPLTPPPPPVQAAALTEQERFEQVCLDALAEDGSADLEYDGELPLGITTDDATAHLPAVRTPTAHHSIFP
jgi:hypothetical protein